MNALLPARPRKAISLTALIDVVFILLMFFMLTSSFTQWNSQQIKASVGGEQVASSHTGDMQFLLLKNDGLASVFSAGKRSGAEPLEQALQRIDASALVTLIPDAELTVQQILDSIATLHRADITQISLGQSSQL